MHDHNCTPGCVLCSNDERDEVREFTCSICFDKFEGFGHNASPINEGRCCDDCNELVVAARINIIANAKGK